MTGPDPAVAATRVAVRRALTAGDPGSAPVLVACSGGADSLALLAAAVFEAREQPWPVVGVTVDHGLHEASAEVATHVIGQMAALGADETASIRVKVEGDGPRPRGGRPQARYAVLEELADRLRLLDRAARAHPRRPGRDRACWASTRGSGGPLAGRHAPGRSGSSAGPCSTSPAPRPSRPAGPRTSAGGADPANEDPRFTRSRVRRDVLPLLETELGPGVAQNLARTADLLRADVEHLDDLADAAYAGLPDPLPWPPSWSSRPPSAPASCAWRRCAPAPATPSSSTTTSVPSTRC
jgi:tRNA(Ile)-lysidine synthase